MNNNVKNNKQSREEKKDFPGYPIYPANQDIYSHAKEETEIDPEDPGKLKSRIEKIKKINEKNFEEDITGGDLDVPGTELDDQQENIGSEDEENNIYSSGDN